MLPHALSCTGIARSRTLAIQSQVWLNDSAFRRPEATEDEVQKICFDIETDGQFVCAKVAPSIQP